MDKEKVLDYLNKNIKDGEYELAMRTNTYNTRMYMELLPFIKKMKKEIVVGAFDKEDLSNKSILLFENERGEFRLKE